MVETVELVEVFVVFYTPQTESSPQGLLFTARIVLEADTEVFDPAYSQPVMKATVKQIMLQHDTCC